MRRMVASPIEMYSISNRQTKALSAITMYFTKHALLRLAERSPGLTPEAAFVAIGSGIEVVPEVPAPRRAVLFWSVPDNKPLVALVAPETNAVVSLVEAWNEGGGALIYTEGIEGEKLIAYNIHRADIRTACIRAGVVPPERFVTSPHARPEADSARTTRFEFRLRILYPDGRRQTRHVCRCDSDADEMTIEKAATKALSLFDPSAVSQAALVLCAHDDTHIALERTLVAARRNADGSH